MMVVEGVNVVLITTVESRTKDATAMAIKDDEAPTVGGGGCRGPVSGGWKKTGSCFVNGRSGKEKAPIAPKK